MNQRDNNRDWSDALRGSLEGSEITPSDNLWSRIDSSLSAMPINRAAILPKRKASFLGVGTRVALLAVAAISAVALFLFVDRGDVTGEVHQIVDFEELVASKTQEDESNIEVQEVAAHRDIIVASRRGNNKILRQVTAARTVASELPIEAEELAVNDKIEPTAKPEQKIKKDIKSGESKSVKEPRYYDQLEDQRGGMSSKKAASRPKLSLYYAGAAGSNSSNSAQNSMYFSEAMATYGSEICVPGSLNSMERMTFDSRYQSAQVTHKQPLGVGLNLECELLDNLSLSAGLDYKLLSSDVKMLENSDILTQEIHLIGLPVHLNYKFLRFGNFSLYSSLGANVEYCLGAKLGNIEVNEREWHYSAEASLGAEYSITDWLGVYFEPSAQYYFTQTNLKSLINDSPVMFNLSLGFNFRL